MRGVVRQWICPRAIDNGVLLCTMRGVPILELPDNHAKVSVKPVSIHANTRSSCRAEQSRLARRAVETASRGTLAARVERGAVAVSLPPVLTWLSQQRDFQ